MADININAMSVVYANSLKYEIDMDYRLWSIDSKK